MALPKRRKETKRRQKMSTVPLHLLWVKRVLKQVSPLISVLLSLAIYYWLAKPIMPEETALQVFWVCVLLGVTAGKKKMTLEVVKAILLILRSIH